MVSLLDYLEQPEFLGEGSEGGTSVSACLTIEEVESIESSWDQLSKAVRNGLDGSTLMWDVRSLCDSQLREQFEDHMFDLIGESFDQHIGPLIKRGLRRKEESTLEVYSNTHCILQKISEQIRQYHAILTQLSSVGVWSSPIPDENERRNRNEQSTESTFHCKLDRWIHDRIFKDACMESELSSRVRNVLMSHFHLICQHSHSHSDERPKSKKDGIEDERILPESTMRCIELFPQIMRIIREDLKWNTWLRCLLVDCVSDGLRSTLDAHYSAKIKLDERSHRIDVRRLQTPGLLNQFVEWVDGFVLTFVRSVLIDEEESLSESILDERRSLLNRAAVVPSPKSVKRRRKSEGTPSKGRCQSTSVSMSTLKAAIKKSVLRCSLAMGKDEERTTEDWRRDLSRRARTMFAHMRCDEVLEVVLHWPDSKASADDLSECLDGRFAEWSELQMKLVNELKERVLHCGVRTSRIIHVFILIFDALRYLDPTGLSFRVVSLPLAAYLSARKDCISAIVDALFDSDTQPRMLKALMSQSQAPSPERQAKVRRMLQSETDGRIDDSDDGESSEDETDPRTGLFHSKWKPSPYSSSRLTPSLSICSRMDAVSLLVCIFGSNEEFADGYTRQCGQRLMNRLNDWFDTEEEQRYLELIKQKFGEELMVDCDIMLRDVHHSGLVCSDRDCDPRFSALIVSARHWPIPDHLRAIVSPDDDDGFMLDSDDDSSESESSSTVRRRLAKEQFDIPAEVSKMRESFDDRFEREKGGMMQLKWMNELGKVDLDLCFHCGNSRVSVSPLKATIVMFLAQKEGTSALSKAELMSELKMKERECSDCLSFWTRLKVIVRCDGDLFRLAQSESEEKEAYRRLEEWTEHRTLLALPENPDSEGDKSAQIETAILNNLSTLTSHPIQRIMNYLAQYKSALPLSVQSLVTEQSVVEQHLARLCQANKVAFQDGLFLKL